MVCVGLSGAGVSCCSSLKTDHVEFPDGENNDKFHAAQIVKTHPRQKLQQSIVCTTLGKTSCFCCLANLTQPPQTSPSTLDPHKQGEAIGRASPRRSQIQKVSLHRMPWEEVRDPNKVCRMLRCSQILWRPSMLQKKSLFFVVSG